MDCSRCLKPYPTPSTLQSLLFICLSSLIKPSFTSNLTDHVHLLIILRKSSLSSESLPKTSPQKPIRTTLWVLGSEHGSEVRIQTEVRLQIVHPYDKDNKPETGTSEWKQETPTHDLPRHAFKSAPVCPHPCARGSLLRPLTHTHMHLPPLLVPTPTPVAWRHLNRHPIPCAQSRPHT